ncbi:Putative universal stress protein [Planctomycetes bacterium K23_9]|uniref:Universal stress protein n=2 Tax=Stieleria marina TaxID=1930275 RepID=A0A517NQW1_9BACT|nr:Putative universal stress protein [Planctomycetes bacterium K23_9]
MNVLLATDGSKDAIHAAQFLSTLQCKEPISLTVLTTTYAPDRIGGTQSQAWFPEWRKLEYERVTSHHNLLRDLLEPLGSKTHFVHVDGAAAHEILKLAEQIDADLIVLGACGHSAVGRILLGSVSDSVATHATCSVLIVRPESEDANTEPGTCRITLAYDGSESSTAAVDELQHFDWPQCCSVNVLSVVTAPVLLLSEYPVLLDQHNEVAVDEARKKGEQLVATLAGCVAQPTAQVATGEHIGETIIANAAESDSNLIVMGDTGRGFLGKLLLGSVSKYVLRHSTTSVWISRHHRKTSDVT